MRCVAVLAAGPHEKIVTGHFHFDLMAASLERWRGNVGNHITGQESPVIEKRPGLIRIGPSSATRPYNFEMVAQIIPSDGESRTLQRDILNVLLHAIFK